jgi:hypothetical protein
MRKRMVMLFSSFLVVALVALIPGELALAKLASPSQPAAPVSAQQEEVDKWIEEILLELNRARGMTTDSEVIDGIDGIIDAVRKLNWLEFTNQGDYALRLKYSIAEQLEKLINDLPLASPGMTTAAAVESNPLYEELVRVRAKIDRLIDLETIPEAVPPPIPTISRVPETERLIVYSAKFLCGPAFGKEGVQPGSYSTAINVHNPHNGRVYLYKKAVIANREDEDRGRISDFHKVALGPDEAIEIDCIDIYGLLGPEPEESEEVTQQPETGLTTAPSIQSSSITPVSSLVRFIKGFVVIYASAPLDVVAVYTASTPVGFSLDVEYLSPSTAATVPVEPPPEEERCPLGCSCLTRAEAEKMGLTAPCNGEMTICEYDEQQRPLRYCFTEPTEQPECPRWCDCLALTPAEAEERGYSLCNGQEMVCGYDAQQNRMLCYEKAGGEECPQGCDCLALTQEEAREEGLVQCSDASCGTDASGRVMYCYRETTQVECPQGCDCLALTPAEAERKGYSLCNGQEMVCGYDAAGNALYCYEPPVEEECPQGCRCLTELEAKGYSLCGGKQIPCGYVAGGPQKWCYEPAVATRLTIEPTQDSNLVGTEHAVTVTVYDKYGNPLPSATVTFTVTGVHSLGPTQLTTNTSGKAVFEYTGKNTGTDTIVATIGGLQATAFKTWYRRGQ